MVVHARIVIRHTPIVVLRKLDQCNSLHIFVLDILTNKASHLKSNPPTHHASQSSNNMGVFHDLPVVVAHCFDELSKPDGHVHRQGLHPGKA